MIVVGFLKYFSDLGVGWALVQLRDLQEAHIRSAFTITMFAGITVGAVVWGVSPLMAYLMEMPGLEPVLKGLSPIFIIQSIGNISQKLVERSLEYQRLAFVDVASYGIGFGTVGIGMALTGFGVWALVAATLGEAVVRSAILLWLQPHSVRPIIHLEAMQSILFFGGGFTAAGFVNYWAKKGDDLVVGRWLGAASLGVYDRAYTLLEATDRIVGRPLDKVLFPSFARIQEESGRVRRAFKRGFSLFGVFFMPVSAVAVIFSQEVVAVTLGGQWDAAIIPFRILAAGIFFRNGYKLCDILARGCGRVYGQALRHTFYAIAVIGGALVGQQWGVNGVAAAALFALFVNFVGMVHLSLDITGLKWISIGRLLARPLVLAVIAGTLAYVLRWGFQIIGWSPLFRLVGACGIIGGIAGTLAWLRPHTFGKDGVWLRNQVIKDVG
jgi:PST family polysaccharide transporter